MRWTKGFDIADAIGKDVCALLQDEIDKLHLPVKVAALVNDTVGTLMARSYSSPGKTGTILGAIFGTGTNGAYVEKLDRIHKLTSNASAKGSYDASTGEMIVNTEWGAFNNSRSTLPTTPFDNKLDRESINPRFQAFEKFISGMYLGEITRNVLLSLIDAAPKPLLFGGKSTDVLNAHYGLDTAVMSAVEEAWEANIVAGTNETHTNLVWEESLTQEQKDKLDKVRKVVVTSLGFKDADVSLRDAAIVRRVVSLVAGRAAKLSGCAIAATLVQTERAVLGGGQAPPPKKGEEKKIGVGVDGSLIQFYPNYERSMRESLRLLVGEEVEKRTEIGMAKDGSGVGAALGALQAIKALQARQAPPIAPKSA